MKQTNFKRIICVTICAVMMLGIFAGCGERPVPDIPVPGQMGAGQNVPQPGGQDAPPAEGISRVRLARNERVLTFDQAASMNISSNHLIRAINDSLVFMEGGQIVPRLATSWEINDEATEFIFQLRTDARFSNGSPFTARDVQATFMYPVENNLANSASFQPIERVEILGDHEVKFYMSEPFGAFLSLASTWGVVYHALVEGGPDVMATQIIGTGPYMLEENVPDVRVLLVRNPYYWGEAPYFDEYEYIIILEDSTRLAAAQNGEIDIAENMDPSVFGIIEAHADLYLYQVALADMHWLGIKTDREPFTDINVRRALSLSIDRQALVNIVQGGQVGGGIISEVTLGGGRLPPYEFDPDLARELLAASDYDGRELVFLSFTGAFTMTMEQLEAIQAMMTAVGFNVLIDVFDNATFMERRSAELFDFFWTGAAHPNADPNVFFTSRIMGNTQMCNWFHDEMFEYIRLGNQLSDINARADAYARVNELARYYYAPFIGLNETMGNYAVRNTIDEASLARAFGADRIVHPRFLRGA